MLLLSHIFTQLSSFFVVCSLCFVPGDPCSSVDILIGPGFSLVLGGSYLSASRADVDVVFIIFKFYFAFIFFTWCPWSFYLLVGIIVPHHCEVRVSSPWIDLNLGFDIVDHGRGPFHLHLCTA